MSLVSDLHQLEEKRDSSSSFSVLVGFGGISAEDLINKLKEDLITANLLPPYRESEDAGVTYFELCGSIELELQHIVSRGFGDFLRVPFFLILDGFLSSYSEMVFILAPTGLLKEAQNPSEGEQYVTGDERLVYFSPDLNLFPLVGSSLEHGFVSLACGGPGLASNKLLRSLDRALRPFFDELFLSTLGGDEVQVFAPEMEGRRRLCLFCRVPRRCPPSSTSPSFFLERSFFRAFDLEREISRPKTSLNPRPPLDSIRRFEGLFMRP